MGEPDTDPTAEDVADQIGKISATEEFTVPSQVADEVVEVMRRLALI